MEDHYPALHLTMHVSHGPHKLLMATPTAATVTLWMVQYHQPLTSAGILIRGPVKGLGVSQKILKSDGNYVVHQFVVSCYQYITILISN